MDHQHFEEKDIEKLLHNMPKMNDNRQFAEIYRGVQMKMNKKQKNKKLFLIPALSIISAIILFVLISPVLLQKSKQESKSDSLVIHKNAASDSTSTSNSKSEQSKQNVKANVFSDRSNNQFNKTAVYEEDVKDNNILTYGVFTQDAVVVPVSVVTPKDGTDWITQYKKMADLFPDKMKYLDNYLPLHGDIQYDSNSKIIHVIISKSDLPSITEQIQLNLNRIVQYSFASQDVKLVKFTDENGNPIELGEIGQVQNQIINKTTHTPYFLYKAGNGEEYLLPTDDQYPKLQDALEAMKSKVDDFHLPVIQQDMQLKVSEGKNNQAIIQFTNKANLDNIKNPMNMIESILLTAKNFGYESVLFENMEPLQWNGFDFSKSISVPIAPNRINLNE